MFLHGQFKLKITKNKTLLAPITGHSESFFKKVLKQNVIRLDSNLFNKQITSKGIYILRKYNINKLVRQMNKIAIRHKIKNKKIMRLFCI